ncbi:MAG: flavodoxin [Firmicutes bacterium]|nr:flavodoxin [Bacillota bacterium]
MKTLVVYFSAEGHTARVAREFAESIGADVFEIVPEEPYTDADINWRNPLSRCNKEKFGKKDVPVAGRIETFGDYDTVYIGFPIWYGCAPNVVNTFCKDYDWTGKTVKIFATSGGSGIGRTAEKLQPYVKGAEAKDAKLVRSAADLAAWA